MMNQVQPLFTESASDLEEELDDLEVYIIQSCVVCEFSLVDF